MTGGTTVADEDEARAYTLKLQVELGCRDVRVGEHLEVPACQPEWVLKRCEEEDGRPCPRAVLSEDNAVAWQVLSMSLNERSRPLVPFVLEDAPRGERGAIARRVAAALADERVNEELDAMVERERERARKEEA